MSSNAGDTTSTGASSAGDCGPLDTRVRTTVVELEPPAVPSNEWYPTLLAARPDSTSLLGYKATGAVLVRVIELDASDNVVATVLETPGEEAHALLAHEDGGALVFAREDPEIFNAQYCRPTPQQPPCSSLELVRFDSAGNPRMTATLTDKLSVGTEGALFIWWFEHTARIAYAEGTYGVYFRSARTSPQRGVPEPVDTLRFVDSAGNRRTRGWDFGCIQSWSVRLGYNGVWAAVCHGGENPNAHRVVLFDGDQQRDLRILEGIPPAYRSLGGLSSVGNDFWLSYSQRVDDALELRLARIDSAGQIVIDPVISEAEGLDFDMDYAFRTYHADFGEDLLLGWQTNNELIIATADRDTGELLEGPAPAGAPIDRFVEFVPYPNGDVGWANTSQSGTTTVTRVLHCQVD